MNNYERKKNRERKNKQNIPKDGISWLLLEKTTYETNEVSFCSHKSFIIRWYFRAGFRYGNDFVTVLVPVTEAILCFQGVKKQQELGHRTQWEHIGLSQRFLGNKWPWKSYRDEFLFLTLSFWNPKYQHPSRHCYVICGPQFSTSRSVFCCTKFRMEFSNEKNNCSRV